MPDDIRKGLPSASSFEMDALCPGRRQLLAMIPDNIIDVRDEFAERGIRIHKALEKRDPSDLDDDDRKIYENGIRTEKVILGDWCRDFNLINFQERQAEERLWVHWLETAKPAASAQLDRHYISHDGGIKHVLAIDHKTLWATSLTPAERNYQARIQAVVAAQEYDAQHVRVVFNKAMSGKSDPVDYDEANLVRAHESVLQSIWETKQPNAKRSPGNHCNRCLAKSLCREAAAFSMLPSVVNSRELALTKVDIGVMVEQMSPADLALVHRRASVIGKILESVKLRLKTFSEDELKAVGLGRFPGGRLDPIIKTKDAFDFLKSFGISEEELWSALKISKGELVDALRRDQGWGKDQASGFVRSRLLPFIEKKNADDSIGEL